MFMDSKMTLEPIKQEIIIKGSYYMSSTGFFDEVAMEKICKCSMNAR